MGQKKAYNLDRESKVVDDKDKIQTLIKHVNKIANALIDNEIITVTQLNNASHSQWPGD